MLLDFAKRLGEKDEDLAIKLKACNGLIQASIEFGKLGDIYFYSSTDLLDVYNRLNNFIEALDDPMKFYKLCQDIQFEEFEV